MRKHNPKSCNEEAMRENLQIQYGVKIIKHMIDIAAWVDQMNTSMDTYITKVEAQIYRIYQQGIIMIANSRLHDVNRLIAVITEEKDAAEADLLKKCERMKELIFDVARCEGSNKVLKQQVLELLQIMRKPKLPDIHIALAFPHKKSNRMYKRMRAMFPVKNKKLNTK